MRLFRLIKIQYVAFQFGLDEFALSHSRLRFLRVFVRNLIFWRKLDKPRGERLRLALEAWAYFCEIWANVINPA